MTLQFDLSDEQRRAASSRACNTLVLAGAGTGKTRTLIGRVLHLVTELGVPGKHILLLAFTHHAALEMKDRLTALAKQESRLASVDVKTFHSLGYSLINKSRAQPCALTELTEDSAFGRYLYEEMYKLCSQSPMFRRSFFDWASLAQLHAKNPQGYLTLAGNLSHSPAHLLCENLIFEFNLFAVPRALLSIQSGKLAQRGRSSARLLKCDYLLPLNRVAVFIRPAEQCEPVPIACDAPLYFHHAKGSVNVVQCLHLQVQHTWQDTLDAFRSAFSVLASKSRQRLKLCRNWEQACAHANEIGRILRLHTSGKIPQQKGEWAYVLNRLLIPLQRRYRCHLRRRNQLDFNMMLDQACRLIATGKLSGPWTHVLIDEFQDLSLLQYRLLQALRSRRSDLQLFCVGDDWQSIYRFAGSDIAYVTDFERRIGPHDTFRLTRTHRFDQHMCQISGEFILQNPNQSRKHLAAAHGRRNPLTLVSDDTPLMAIFDDICCDAVSLASDPAKMSATVVIMARFKHLLPDAPTVRKLNQRFPALAIRCSTVHAAKGNEADYVVILVCDEGEHGFPSSKSSSEIIESLLPGEESFEYEEERRLFYVALTRTRRQCYIVHSRKQASPFVFELRKNRSAFKTRLRRGGGFLKGIRIRSILGPVIQGSQRFLQRVLSITEK